MRLPNLPNPGTRTRRQQTLAFGGLDYTYSARAGKMSDCMNLSTRNYPALSPRLGMRRDAHYNAGTAAFSWDDKLVVVDGTDLIYDGTVKGQVAAGPKQFAVVNTKLCVWPDKVCVDLTTGTFQHLDADVTPAQGTLEYDGDTVSAPALAGAFQADDLVTITGTRYGIGDVTDGRVISAEGETLTFPEDTFPRAKTKAGGSQAFMAGAVVNFYRTKTGTNPWSANWTLTLPAAVPDTALFVTGTPLKADTTVYPGLAEATIQISAWDTATRKLLFTEEVSCSPTPPDPETLTEEYQWTALDPWESGVTFTRKVPDLDFICESGNRLWGISNRQTNTVWNPETGEPDTFTSRVIYASALGDPTK